MQTFGYEMNVKSERLCSKDKDTYEKVEKDKQH